MLTLWGSNHRFCDGLDRRGFLQVGALGGAITLADLFRCQAAAGSARRSSAAPSKSVIMIWLLGGPPQIDTYDLKPSAPTEYRGEFKPIRTNVPGLDICELFPRQAAMMDKIALLRGVVATPPNGHGDSEIVSGFNEAENRRSHHPSFGAVISRLRGPAKNGMPPFVTLRYQSFATPSSFSEYDLESGYLGVAHRPYIVKNGKLTDLQLPPTVSLDRLHDRKSLLKGFDTLRRDLDASGNMAGLDVMTQRALGVITSAALRDALDLSQEDPRVLDRYGKRAKYPHGWGTQLLAARRLVEAGAGFVSVATGYWDTHANNFNQLKDTLCPLLDIGLSALVEDLHQRGLDKEVVVVVWGEFGRTPRINKDAGRDHWLPVMSALVAGGGLKTGQVIGATDARAEFPKDRPYRIPQVLSTVYRTLGIDPAMSFPSNNGRPMYLLDDREPVAELL